MKCAVLSSEHQLVNIALLLQLPWSLRLYSGLSPKFTDRSIAKLCFERLYLAATETDAELPAKHKIKLKKSCVKVGEMIEEPKAHPCEAPRNSNTNQKVYKGWT